jgi:hypothetical protein
MVFVPGTKPASETAVLPRVLDMETWITSFVTGPMSGVGIDMRGVRVIRSITEIVLVASVRLNIVPSTLGGSADSLLIVCWLIRVLRGPMLFLLWCSRRFRFGHAPIAGLRSMGRNIAVPHCAISFMLTRNRSGRQASGQDHRDQENTE